MQESDFDKILKTFPDDPNLRSELKLVFQDDQVNTNNNEDLGNALAHRTRLWIQWHTFLLVVTFGFYAIAYAVKRRHDNVRNIFTVLKEAKALRKKFSDFLNYISKMVYDADVQKSTEDNGDAYVSSHTDSPITSAMKKFMGRKKEVVEKSIDFEQNVKACFPLRDGSYLVQFYDYTLQILSPAKELLFYNDYNDVRIITGFVESQEFIFITSLDDRTGGCHTSRFSKLDFSDKPYLMLHGPVQYLDVKGDVVYVAIEKYKIGENLVKSEVETFEQNMRVGLTKTNFVDNPLADHSSEEVIAEVEHINPEDVEREIRAIPSLAKYDVDHTGMIVALSEAVFAIRSANKKSVHVWNLAFNTEQPVATLNSPDDWKFRRIIKYGENIITTSDVSSGGDDHGIHFWDISKQKITKMLDTKHKIFNFLTLSSDNLYLAAATDDGVIFIYNIEDSKIIKELDAGHKITSLAFNDLNQLTCSVMAHVKFEIPNEFPVDKIMIWEIPEFANDKEDDYRRQLIFKNQPQLFPCNQLRDGNFVIQGDDNKVKIIDKHGQTKKALNTFAKAKVNQNNKMIKKTINIPTDFREFVQMKDGTIIGAGETVQNKKAVIFIWRKNDTQFIELPIGKIATIDVFDNTIILTSHQQMFPWIPSLITGLQITQSNLQVIFSQQLIGGILVYGKIRPCLMANNKVAVNIEDQLQLWRIHEKKLHKIELEDPVTAGRMLKLNNEVLLITDNNSLFTYSIEKESIIMKKSVHEKEIHQIAASPNGKYFASLDEDGIILVWDAKSFELIGFHQVKPPIATLSLSNNCHVSAVIANEAGDHASHIEYFKTLKDPEDLPKYSNDESSESTLEL